MAWVIGLGWERARTQALGIKPALALSLIAIATAGCSTLMEQDQYSMVEPATALSEPTWGGTATVASQGKAGEIDQTPGSPWPTRVYEYRGGRDPQTGLAKIQM